MEGRDLAGIPGRLRRGVGSFGLARGTLTDAFITAVTRALLFVVVPAGLLTLFIVLAQNQQDNLLVSGLEEMRLMVLIFGTILVVIAFLWAYHLRSTKARLLFGLIGAGLLIVYAGAILLTGGFNDVLQALGWTFPPLLAFGIICYIAISDALKFVRDYSFFRTAMLKTTTEQVIYKPKLGWGEFDRRLGSLSLAASSAKRIAGRITRWAFLFLLFIWILSFFGFDSSSSQIIFLNTLGLMCGIILLAGIPMVATAWFTGYYPKGTISRTTFDVILSVILILLIFLVFAGSGLPQIARQGGTDFPIVPIALTLVVWAAFNVLRAFGEFRDERRTWKSRIGYTVVRKKRFRMMTPESRLYDFSFENGKFSRGLRAAQRTFFWFVVLPEILVLLAIGSARAGGGDTGPLFDAMVTVSYLVPFLGLLLACISFGRGFYPPGSYSRMLIGLLYVPTLFFYIFFTFLAPEVQNAFIAKGVIIPFNLISTLVIVSILFVGFLQGSELVDHRKAYLKSIGRETKPLKPIKKMSRLQEFRFRFGSTYEATRWARKGMVRYLYYTTIMLIVLLTIINSLTLNVAGIDLASLNANLRSVFIIIIVVAIPLAAVRSAYGFYPSGSTPKLFFGFVMCLVGATYTYLALKGGNILRGGDFGSVQAGLSVDFTLILYGFLIGWVLFAITIILEYTSYRKDYVANGYHPVVAAEVKARQKQQKILEKEEKRAKKAASEGISIADVEEDEAPDSEQEVENEIRNEIGEDALRASKTQDKGTASTDRSPPTS